MCSWRWRISSSCVSFTAPVMRRGAVNGWEFCLQRTMKLGKLLTQFICCGDYTCRKQAMWVQHVFKRCCWTCSPKANWESANDMLKGDMMTFGSSGVVFRFCSSCTPSFWMAAAMVFMDCEFLPVDQQSSSCPSSDEPPLGWLVSAVAVAFASVVFAFSVCGVVSFSTF